jgi:VWFA-related protein
MRWPIDRWLRVPLALAAAAVLAAQGIDPKEMRMSAVPYLPKPAYSMRAEARLVDVGVVVRDNRGHSVSGLTKGDFQIHDNGKPREVTAFSVHNFVPAAAAPSATIPAGAPARQPEKPRFVGLVFDDLGMPPGDLYHARTAAKRFLESGMAAGDRVGVLTISSGMVLPFTADLAAIEQAIDKVVLRERKTGSTGCPRLLPYDAYVIANHLDSAALDAKVDELLVCEPSICVRPASSRNSSGPRPACQQAVQLVQATANQLWEQVRLQSRTVILTLENFVDAMAQLDGQRAILLASSGFLSGTLEFDEDEVVGRALRSDVVINSLDAKGLYTVDGPEPGQGTTVRSRIYAQGLGTRPKESSNDAMANLAEATGGLFFHNSNDLEMGFRELGMQPETSYLLGYAPDPPDGKYHHLKVTLTSGHHETVQARKGYMAVAAPPGKPAPVRRIDREVLGASQLDEAPVKLVARQDEPGSGKLAAKISFQWDVTHLAFKTNGGVRSQKLHMVAALLDGKGNFVTGKEGVAELALSETTFALLAPSGLNLVLRLEAPPGTYQLRLVAADEGDAHVSASTQALELK